MAAVECNLDWLAGVESRVPDLFLSRFVHEGAFSEAPPAPSLRGLAAWAGLHDLVPLAGPDFRACLRVTLERALGAADPDTGLLPDALPAAGEPADCQAPLPEADANLDGANCWAHLALLYDAYARDGWLDPWLSAIERSVDHQLAHYLGRRNRGLLSAGPAGDWTESTAAEADNANASAQFYRVLVLLTEAEASRGRAERGAAYRKWATSMLREYNRAVAEGGFWDGERGQYVHANDGTGAQVQGDRYFETTANVLSILFGLASRTRADAIVARLAAPELAAPLPIRTNHPARSDSPATSTALPDGAVSFWLGGHAAAAALRSGRPDLATAMAAALFDYERKHGALHRLPVADGAQEEPPDLASSGSLFSVLADGVCGLEPCRQGLRLVVRPLLGMTTICLPLFYAGADMALQVDFSGHLLSQATCADQPLPIRGANEALLPPAQARPGSVIRLSFGG
jgi:hypothetical protein